MKLFLTLILPIIVLCIPIIGYLMYYKLEKAKTRKKVVLVGLAVFLVGLLTPWLATFVSLYGISHNLPSDAPNSLTGVAVFFFIGYLITLIGTPIIGIMLYFSTEKKPIQERL